MSYIVQQCPILRKAQLSADVYSFTVAAPEIAAQAVAGQFAQILVPGKVLRRPISLCEIGEATLRFVIQIRGEGTAQLCAMQPGQCFDVLGPLGRGFPLAPAGKAVFVGGGIGTPPLLGAAAAYPGAKAAVLGFRNAAAVILERDFAALCETRIATDDGSLGVHGLVTKVLAHMDFDRCFACGPGPMLAAVAELCRSRGASCYVSLEQRMACGIGACLGCAVELQGPQGRRFGHVCKDGPVFDAAQVVWQGGRA